MYILSVKDTDVYIYILYTPNVYQSILRIFLRDNSKRYLGIASYSITTHLILISVSTVTYT